MTEARILRDEAYSQLLNSLAGASPQVAQLLEDAAMEALPVGTVVTVTEIDSLNRAHYTNPLTGEPWYSPEGWYEVVDD